MENKNLNPEEENQQEQNKNKKRKSSSSAANLDAIIRSPTDAARSHRHTDGWSNQGTNISYEGNTAPGGGGSVGTGQASGQSAVGATIRTTDANDLIKEEKTEKKKDEDKGKQDKNEDSDPDTLGNP